MLEVLEFRFGPTPEGPWSEPVASSISPEAASSLAATDEWSAVRRTFKPLRVGREFFQMRTNRYVSREEAAKLGERAFAAGTPVAKMSTDDQEGVLSKIIALVLTLSQSDFSVATSLLLAATHVISPSLTWRRREEAARCHHQEQATKAARVLPAHSAASSQHEDRAHAHRAWRMKDERTGSQRISDERARQISSEDYDAEHDDDDDDHGEGDLALAAACYAAHGVEPLYIQTETDGSFHFRDPWPWMDDDDKRPKNPSREQRIRLLEKAGALLAAEIDRLLRRTQAELAALALRSYK